MMVPPAPMFLRWPWATTIELTAAIRTVTLFTRRCIEPCGNSSDATQDASRIADRQTIGWDISGHDTTRADGGVVSNTNSRKYYRVSANPDVIFDYNWCGRRHLTLFQAMFVSVQDKQVMTQQTMTPDLDLLVCRNRYAVVHERMIAYRNCGTLVRDNLDWDNVPHQAYAIPKFHVTAGFQINAAKKSHRKRYASPTSNP